jgi:hypothetical protein
MNETKYKAVQDGRASVAEFGQGPLDSVCQSLEAELRRVAAERDAFEQEVFETDRYAAHVSHERQNLFWRNEALQAELAAATEALEQHRRTLAAIYASTSWKFSRPVRALKKLLVLISRR